MTTLTEFLLARIAEDEAAAHFYNRGGAERPVADRWWSQRLGQSQLITSRPLPHMRENHIAEIPYGTAGLGQILVDYIVRFDPSRVLAECEAKRRIIDLASEATGLDMSVDLDRSIGSRDQAAEPYVGDLMLRVLAMPYSAHPNFDESWAVT